MKVSISVAALPVIFATVALDAVGIGLIFPILPALLRDVTGADSVAPYIGTDFMESSCRLQSGLRSAF